VKKRYSFVTNSSSTSFILQTNVFGRLPKLDDFKSKILKRFEDYDLEIYGDEDFTIFSFKIEDEVEDYPMIIGIEMENNVEYDDADNENEFLELNIDFTSQLHVEPNDESHKLFSETIKTVIYKILECYDDYPKCELTLLTTVKDFFGDGWGNDNAMGFYKFICDCKKKETKLLKVIIDPSKSVEKIKFKK
jgi:hypothetical protein